MVDFVEDLPMVPSAPIVASTLRKCLASLSKSPAIPNSTLACQSSHDKAEVSFQLSPIHEEDDQDVVTPRIFTEFSNALCLPVISRLDEFMNSPDSTGSERNASTTDSDEAAHESEEATSQTSPSWSDEHDATKVTFKFLRQSKIFSRLSNLELQNFIVCCSLQRFCRGEKISFPIDWKRPATAMVIEGYVANGQGKPSKFVAGDVFGEKAAKGVLAAEGGSDTLICFFDPSSQSLRPFQSQLDRSCTWLSPQAAREASPKAQWSVKIDVSTKLDPDLDTSEVLATPRRDSSAQDSPPAGVGLLISSSDKGPAIDRIVAGSPAWHCKKLDVGDVVLRIDDEEVANCTVDTIHDKLEGTDGSQVSLTVRKAEGQEASIPLLRQHTASVPILFSRRGERIVVAQTQQRHLSNQLIPGDQILAVDSIPLHDLSSSDILGLLNGPVGSTVILDVRKGSLGFSSSKRVVLRRTEAINIRDHRSSSSPGFTPRSISFSPRSPTLASALKSPKALFEFR